MSYHCSLSQIREPFGTCASRPRSIGWLLMLLRAREEAATIPHPYRSLGQFFEAYHLPHPRKGYWRLCPARRGHVTGIPNSQGVVLATDGMLCYILRSDGSLFRGHYQSWESEQEEVVIEKEPKPQSERRDSAKRRRIMEEYV